MAAVVASDAGRAGVLAALKSARNTERKQPPCAQPLTPGPRHTHTHTPTSDIMEDVVGVEKILKDEGNEKDFGQDRNGGCTVCMFENVADVAFSCGHSFCRSCFSDYAEIEISEGRTRLTCLGCDAEAPYETIRLVLNADESLAAKYESFSLRNALLDDANCRFCPTPDCGYAVIADPECQVVQCLKGCPDFCFICLGPAHDGDCSEVMETLTKVLDSQGYKTCPRCGVLVTKAGGCNSVVCNCGCEFCWVCGRPCHEALHFLPHKPCRQFSSRPPVKASTRLKKYSLAMMASPLLLPVGVLGGGALAVYLGEETLRSLVMGIPVRKKKKRLVAGTAAVASSVVWGPVLGAAGMIVSVVGLTGYFVGFPAFLLHDHLTNRWHSDRRRGGGGSMLLAEEAEVPSTSIMSHGDL